MLTQNMNFNAITSSHYRTKRNSGGEFFGKNKKSSLHAGLNSADGHIYFFISAAR